MLILYTTNFISLGIHLAYAKHMLILYTTSFISLSMHFVTDLINQVSQLLRTELEELVDKARTTMEPIEPCDEEW